VLSHPWWSVIAAAAKSLGTTRSRFNQAHARPDGAPIALTTYPGAFHAFDVAQFKPGVRYLGHWCEYNASVAQDAAHKLRALLTAHLGGGLSGKTGAE
jgi:dienelactone hydrolase